MSFEIVFELKLLVLKRDKTEFLLLLPLNYNGSPGSSLSFVHQIVLSFEIGFELKLLVLKRDKTEFLLLLPLNYNGSPGSSLSIVHLFFLNAKLRSRKEGYIYLIQLW